MPVFWYQLKAEYVGRFKFKNHRLSVLESDAAEVRKMPDFGTLIIESVSCPFEIHKEVDDAWVDTRAIRNKRIDRQRGVKKSFSAPKRNPEQKRWDELRAEAISAEANNAQDLEGAELNGKDIKKSGNPYRNSVRVARGKHPVKVRVRKNGADKGKPAE